MTWRRGIVEAVAPEMWAQVGLVHICNHRLVSPSCSSAAAVSIAGGWKSDGNCVYETDQQVADGQTVPANSQQVSIESGAGFNGHGA